MDQHAGEAIICMETKTSYAPLDLGHGHGDEVVELQLGVEAIARAGVLPAGSASPLPRLGFGDPLHGQHLQPAV